MIELNFEAVAFVPGGRYNSKSNTESIDAPPPYCHLSTCLKQGGLVGSSIGFLIGLPLGYSGALLGSLAGSLTGMGVGTIQWWVGV